MHKLELGGCYCNLGCSPNKWYVANLRQAKWLSVRVRSQEKHTTQKCFNTSFSSCWVLIVQVCHCLVLKTGCFFLYLDAWFCAAVRSKETLDMEDGDDVCPPTFLSHTHILERETREREAI